MKYRFFNAKILTMKDGASLISGEVHTKDERITYVGPAISSFKEEEMNFDLSVDCGGNLLMPGFKDAHTHSAMTFLRSSADDLPLDEWLNHQVFPYEAKLTGEDIYTLTNLAILEYLTSGITSVMEMYLTPDTIAASCNDMGMRCVQVGSCNNFSQSPELVEEWYQRLNGVSPLTSFEIGFHAEYTCSPELIGKFADLSHKYKAPVYTHLAETAGEVKGCRERYGMTPVAYLCERGIFDFGGAGYHMVHVDAEDLRIIKEKGICPITNPASNSKLASGIAPISEYLKNDITVGIGTDGPASNNCLDMFREMFLTTALAKLRESDASAVPAFEVLKMATTNGAHIMNLPDCDVLSEGKLADIIMIDLLQPNMQPQNNIISNLVYSGSKQNIAMTMIHGKILYETFTTGAPRFHTAIEPLDIYKDAETVCRRIFN